MARGFRVFDNQMATNVNRFPEGENMPSNWQTGKTINGKLVWRPSEVSGKTGYDAEIHGLQTPVRTIMDDKVTVVYSFVDKPLIDIQKRKTQQLKAEGRAIVYAKYDEDARARVYSGIDSAATHNTDLQTIRNHWQTNLKPLIDNALNVAEVKAIEATGALAWPVI